MFLKIWVTYPTYQESKEAMIIYWNDFDHIYSYKNQEERLISNSPRIN